MTIDIRKLPTLYINLDIETQRNAEMQDMLNRLGFVSFNRFPAKRGVQLNHDGPFLSHISALWLAYTKYTDDYVLIMEDKTVIADIDTMNENIMKARDTYDFDVFTSYFKHPDKNFDEPFDSFLSSPPMSKTHCMYFVVYKRTAILTAIHDMTKRYLTTGCIDIWEIAGEARVCAYYNQYACYPCMTYYPSRSGAGQCIVIDISNESDICQTYRDLSRKWCRNTRFGNEMLFRKYYFMNDHSVVELTARDELRRLDISPVEGHGDILKYILGRFVNEHKNIIRYYAVIDGTLYRIR